MSSLVSHLCVQSPRTGGRPTWHLPLLTWLVSTGKRQVRRPLVLGDFTHSWVTSGISTSLAPVCAITQKKGLDHLALMCIYLASTPSVYFSRYFNALHLVLRIIFGKHTLGLSMAMVKTAANTRRDMTALQTLLKVSTYTLY